MTARPLCLIAEDQGPVGLTLAAQLDDAGFGVVSALPDNRSILHWLTQNRPDVALLDFMLRDGPCVPVARALKARGIPFAIYSGMPPRGRLPAELQGVPWLNKPARREQIAETLGALFEHKGAENSPRTTFEH
ncbi:histidine kinase [Microvirga puerhi]|uniref:Histidine kinase n=1 Tax=Microvirga puerhi TaxID=2876078 RepID=A0ABS7VSA2_9HYPH|nr:histidine kinase [Microvirga puerhi]MBZ6078431.1 histidine kinase [Microvirga puerhi]